MQSRNAILGITVVALFVLAGYFLVKSQSNTSQPTQPVATQPTKKTESEEAMMGKGFLMKDGKMIVEEGKKTSPMAGNATLKDGSAVTVTGLITRKDGSTLQLKEGESIWEDGTFVKAGEMKKEETSFSGKVLAGKSVLYLVFNKQDYDKALSSGKVVFLDFYANWCPICRAEESNLKAGFDSLINDKIVGFRVNWSDSDTTDDMKKLASDMGVTHKTTKVVLKDGKKVYGPQIEDWDKETLVSKLTSYTQ